MAGRDMEEDAEVVRAFIDSLRLFKKSCMWARGLGDRVTCCSLSTTAASRKHNPTSCHASIAALTGPTRQPHFSFFFLESLSLPLWSRPSFLARCFCQRHERMAELEGLEFGKSDFVLLDEVTMEQFMENLKLR